jgi:hypothetical protein
MSGEQEPTQRLSAEEMRVLKFAVRRQLSRWANRRNPSAEQRARRAALHRVLHILKDDAFAGGCDLHVPSQQQPGGQRRA